MKTILKCINCGKVFPENITTYKCSHCGDLLDVTYDYQEIDPRVLKEEWKSRSLEVWKYKELLPLQPINPVTLGEGGTTLHNCSKLSRMIGLKHLYAKNEGENPTGSFKDRGMTVGINKALALGMKITACASTGNTSASLAAYSAKAGLKCVVLIPSGKIAAGKLSQAIAFGAKVLAIKGNFDDALVMVQKICERYPVYLLNSINPFRLEGQKTLAYEVYEQMNYSIPDNVFVPVGNAGNISAIWKGFCELKKLGFIENFPRMIGVQAEGASPIASMIKENKENLEPFMNPETLASAIRIGSPVNWKKALKVVKESKGTVISVTDAEIIEAQKQLAKTEGLFVEPASAASFAGLKKSIETDEFSSSESFVCVLTGNGLKDPDIISKYYAKPIEVENKIESLLAQLQDIHNDQELEIEVAHG